MPADYPGNDAGQKALAQWLAKQAEKAGLPPELPVMAALVESGVRNLDFGDADSVGFFQMRVGDLEQGRVRRLSRQPRAAGEVVHRHTRSRTRSSSSRAATRTSARTRATWGEWIADVERPAEQYRGRYQLRLEEARRLLR